jgi:hypothetical protein
VTGLLISGVPLVIDAKQLLLFNNAPDPGKKIEPRHVTWFEGPEQGKDVM